MVRILDNKSTLENKALIDAANDKKLNSNRDNYSPKTQMKNYVNMNDSLDSSKDISA